MKEAYHQICIAEIYAQRIDWIMSGDDGEGTFQERLKNKLKDFKKKFATKDWTHLYNGWDVD